MARLVRFNNLREQGIANSRVQLDRMIELYGFPPGRMLTPNVRVWDQEEEIDPWVASRPVENDAPLKGAAKIRREARDARLAGKIPGRQAKIKETA